MTTGELERIKKAIKEKRWPKINQKKDIKLCYVKFKGDSFEKRYKIVEAIDPECAKYAGVFKMAKEGKWTDWKRISAPEAAKVFSEAEPITLEEKIKNLALNTTEIQELPEKEQLDYMIRWKIRSDEKVELVVRALNRGVLDGVKTR